MKHRHQVRVEGGKVRPYLAGGLRWVGGPGVTGQLPGTALHPGATTHGALTSSAQQETAKGKGSFGNAKDRRLGLGTRQRVATLPPGGARATLAVLVPPPPPLLLLLQDEGEGLSLHWAWPQRQYQSLPPTPGEGSGREPSVQAARLASQRWVSMPTEPAPL